MFIIKSPCKIQKSIQSNSLVFHHDDENHRINYRSEWKIVFSALGLFSWVFCWLRQRLARPLKTKLLVIVLHNGWKSMSQCPKKKKKWREDSNVFKPCDTATDSIQSDSATEGCEHIQMGFQVLSHVIMSICTKQPEWMEKEHQNSTTSSGVSISMANHVKKAQLLVSTDFHPFKSTRSFDKQIVR